MSSLLKGNWCGPCLNCWGNWWGWRGERVHISEEPPPCHPCNPPPTIPSSSWESERQRERENPFMWVCCEPLLLQGWPSGWESLTRDPSQLV
ncbi:hypothetical protein JZ751_010967 [Albula glossodonta]|uniref:Uncharacterized protein n=1 Tax=Albula glossodonta TaxID=121402 RepID=A0A8T2P3Z0_9TELE|nr:hypothetical protein JZ751_010967 [Albula glossodonta]